MKKLITLISAVLLFISLSTNTSNANNESPVTSDKQGRLFLKQSLGHSHNDYYQRNPLHYALKANMFSIEADIFHKDGELYVAHSRDEIKPSRTLKKLYLDPLNKHFKKHGSIDTEHPFGGQVRTSGLPLILMVDFKNDGLKCWQTLEKQLAQYPNLFRHVAIDNEKTTITPAPVIVVASGQRPVKQISKATERFVGIDGRYSTDYHSQAPAHLMPMISTSFSEFLKSVGSQNPNDILIALTDFKSAAHQKGRIARIWATPDSTKMWQLLYQSGIQLINTDKPIQLAKYLNSQSQRSNTSTANAEQNLNK
ncbi:hypothetical protein KS4_02630 [Poriferisphaera corsica]|uniref:Altered inheritance of mitochondria protein 6 n=1 Tax=Poriferisphaera corsica TaxID=2528020 RepID=A0A517YPT8_9BACT|nr:hypothetical protein [Poriferisphaera corsica]QDU32232.1 hypothetical protein KS4_02630 [Poriferisphaera corsica]